MNVASLELCKELYELSGWNEEPDYIWATTYGQPYKLVPRTVIGKDLIQALKQKSFIIPAYDLGYLLRKLPYKVYDDYSAWVYGYKLMPTASTGWKIWYGEVGTDSEMYFNSAETPEDAACKLAIELFKQGVLKSE